MRPGNEHGVNLLVIYTTSRAKTPVLTKQQKHLNCLTGPKFPLMISPSKLRSRILADDHVGASGVHHHHVCLSECLPQFSPITHKICVSWTIDRGPVIQDIYQLAILNVRLHPPQTDHYMASA